MCVPSLVLIAQAVFLLERGQTDRQTNRQTDSTERPTHAGSYTGGVGKQEHTGMKLLLLAGRKPSRGRIQRCHHVSDGNLRKVLCAIHLVTGTDSRRSLRRDVRLVRTTMFP